MKRSTDHILVSHAGALPAPEDLQAMVVEKPIPKQKFEERLPSAVAEVVDTQISIGVDQVNDGELSKRADGGGGFSYYAMARIGGIETREFDAEDSPANSRNITGRDAREYPGFHQVVLGYRNQVVQQVRRNVRPALLATEPLTYIGQEAVDRDIANLRAALEGKGDVEGYLPAIAPGTIEHWLFNEHYADAEAFLYGIADAMHDEYKAITDAGFILQVDDPDLPDGWQMFPDMTVPEYRDYAKVRVEALNHALRDCPTELIRLHVCWGSGHGPHVNDIPLEDIVDIILGVRCGCLSIEAANPRHEHEYKVWGTPKAKLPDGTTLMPGVAGHSSDIVEHPRLVADRLVSYANLVGKENVIAGTDCGIGTRVAHPEIAWGKLKAMVEGAAIASDELGF